MVTQYGEHRKLKDPTNFLKIRFFLPDVELYQRIEHLLGKQLPLFKTDEDEVMALQERIGEAQRTARLELKDIEERHGSKTRIKNFEEDDTEQFSGARKRMKMGNGSGGRDGAGGKRKKFKS